MQAAHLLFLATTLVAARRAGRGPVVRPAREDDEGHGAVDDAGRQRARRRGRVGLCGRARGGRPALAHRHRRARRDGAAGTPPSSRSICRPSPTSSSRTTTTTTPAACSRCAARWRRRIRTRSAARTSRKGIFTSRARRGRAARATACCRSRPSTRSSAARSSSTTSPTRLAPGRVDDRAGAAHVSRAELERAAAAADAGRVRSRTPCRRTRRSSCRRRRGWWS